MYDDTSKDIVLHFRFLINLKGFFFAFAPTFSPRVSRSSSNGWSLGGGFHLLLLCGFYNQKKKISSLRHVALIINFNQTLSKQMRMESQLLGEKSNRLDRRTNQLMNTKCKIKYKEEHYLYCLKLLYHEDLSSPSWSNLPLPK